jgi:hypothetical protein
MNSDKAQRILNELKENKSKEVNTLVIKEGTTIYLNGNFTIPQLKAIIWNMKKREH